MPADRRPMLVGLGAALALAVALALQFAGGLAPCPLCVYQRYPYLAVVLVCLIGMWWRPRLALGIAALALAGNVGLAGYHVAIEQGWVPLPESCAAASTATTIEELRRQLAAAPARCDQVSAAFLGLSLAAWNGGYALALLVAAMVMLRGRPGSAAEQDRYPRVA
jgi:disulfide bond formation protein DsbB